MVWAVLAAIFPLIIAVGLITAGLILFFRRTRSGIHTTGVVVGTAKFNKKYTKLKLDVEAPIVKYTIKGKEYTCTAAKFRMDGTQNYYKGDIINIRVNKKNHHKFEPTESGDTAEKLLIAGGIFIFIIYAATYIRYWNYL